MIKIRNILICGLIICLLSGCSWAPQNYPQEGIWYCQELEIYLDASDYTGVYLDDSGVYAPLFVNIDYGTGFFINYCEDQWCEEYMQDGYFQATDYKFKNGILRITDRETKQVYEFVEIDKEMYPEE